MDMTSFMIYCFIMTFIPGPTNIVILSTVHHYGTKKAREYTYGATIAFGLLLGISAILNTVLITIIPKILIGMQVIGTIYMLYLSYQIYKAFRVPGQHMLLGTLFRIEPLYKKHNQFS